MKTITYKVFSVYPDRDIKDEVKGKLFYWNDIALAIRHEGFKYSGQYYWIVDEISSGKRVKKERGTRKFVIEYVNRFLDSLGITKVKEVIAENEKINNIEEVLNHV